MGFQHLWNKIRGQKWPPFLRSISVTHLTEDTSPCNPAYHARDEIQVPCGVLMYAGVRVWALLSFGERNSEQSLNGPCGLP